MRRNSPLLHQLIAADLEGGHKLGLDCSSYYVLSDVRQARVSGDVTQQLDVDGVVPARD